MGHVYGAGCYPCLWKWVENCGALQICVVHSMVSHCSPSLGACAVNSSQDRCFVPNSKQNGFSCVPMYNKQLCGYACVCEYVWKNIQEYFFCSLHSVILYGACVCISVCTYVRVCVRACVCVHARSYAYVIMLRCHTLWFCVCVCVCVCERERERETPAIITATFCFLCF